MSYLLGPGTIEPSYATVHRTFGVIQTSRLAADHLPVPNPRIRQHTSQVIGMTAASFFQFPNVLPLRLSPTIRGNKETAGRNRTGFEQFLSYIGRPIDAALTIESIKSAIVNLRTGLAITPDQYEDELIKMTKRVRGSLRQEPHAGLVFDISGIAELPEISAVAHISIPRLVLHPATFEQQGTPWAFNQARVTGIPE